MNSSMKVCQPSRNPISPETKSYEYDKGLRVNEITYPDAMTVNYGYNGTGFLESIGSGKKSGGKTAAYASGGTYNTASQLTLLMAGNIFEVMFTAQGKTSSWTYDAKGNRLSENETTGGIYTDSQKINSYCILISLENYSRPQASLIPIIMFIH